MKVAKVRSFFGTFWVFNDSVQALAICLAAFSGAAAQPALLVGHHGLAHHGLVHHAVGGQTSHQAVTTANGEQRSLVQSKVLGASHSSVSQTDNSKGLVEVQPSIGANHIVPLGHAAVVPVATHSVPSLAHPVAHAVAQPAHHVAHAVHATPVLHSAPSYIAPAPTPAPLYHAPAKPMVVKTGPTYLAPAPKVVPTYTAPAPTVASLYSAPAKTVVKTAPSYIAPAKHVVVAHPTSAYLAPAKKMPAPAYIAPAVVKPTYHAPAPTYHASYHPYSYTYAVADDYSKATFSQKESNDGTGLVQGTYSVNLPDGRIQTVNYHANDIDGYVAEVSYSGEAVYPDTPATHPVSHPVAHPALAHHVIAHPLAHTITHPAHAHTVAHPALAHAVAHPIAHAVVSAPVVAHSVVATDPMAAPAKEAVGEDGENDEGSEDSA